MPDFAIYDPGTGQPSTSVRAPGERLTPAGGQPTDEPYEAGDSPSTGRTPENIVAATPGPFSRTKV